MISLEQFQQDQQGKRFSDVLNDDRIDFEIVISFFNNPDRLRRMEESEIHHQRPAFAGVIREFERVPEIDSFLRGYDAHTTQRFRQAVGVLIRLHMEDLGWQRTGRKGSLGTRAPVAKRTTTPGAYFNETGLSRWFTKSEHYASPPEKDILQDA